MSNTNKWRDAEWRDASGQAGTCLQVAKQGDLVGVRDSKQDGQGPVLEFTEAEMAAFIGGVKAGQFDDLA